MNLKSIPPVFSISFSFLTLLLFIFFASISFAAPIGESEQGSIVSDFGSRIVQNASTLLQDGAACTAASQCSGGFCNSGVCASSAPSVTPSPGGGGTVISGGAAPAAAEEEAAPAEEEEEVAAPSVGVEVTEVEIPVTETEAVTEILTGVTAADLGLEEVTAENVEVKQTGTAKTTTTASETLIETVLKQATGEAKTTLEQIKESISTGSSTGIVVETKLEVFEVKAKDTGKTSFVSKISLTFKSDKDLEDVTVVEVIPKSVAANIAQVIFVGEQPKILQSDPIVQWGFPTVKKDETKDLSYIVKKKLDSLNTTTVATSKVVEVVVPPEEKPAIEVPPATIYVVIAVVLIGAVVVYLMKNKKLKLPQRKFKYRYRGS